MISSYLEKFKNIDLKAFYSFCHTPSILMLVQNIFFTVISLQLSLFLRLGDDLSQLSTLAIVLNTIVYGLLGFSVFLGKHIYKEIGYYSSLGEEVSTALSVTYLTILYIPVMYILPQDLSLPCSTPFINWFVLILLLWIRQLIYRFIQNKPQMAESKKFTPSSKPKFEDLLKRSNIDLDLKTIKNMIKGKKVLITGAGGSIGKELTHHILDLSPSHICLLDHSENLLYMADLELSESHPKVPRDNILSDVACRERVRHVMATFKPELVFHTAALKHFLLGEKNPSQAILTNVIGTRNIAEACRDFNVKAMLFTSTNEATHPINIIGATKRLAESYCQALDILERKKPNGTRYINVRMENVLEESGSIITLFMQQIEKGGPITITHPDTIRYFMTLQQAAQLILQTMTFTANFEISPGRIFILDKGVPFKILDLAKEMISYTGLKPEVDIEIKFTGLPAGEKLIEDVSSETFSPTSNPHILMAAPRTMDHGFLGRAFQELEILAKDQDYDSIFRLLHALVPNYKQSTFITGSEEGQEP